MIYFSASSAGFFRDDVHAIMPDDVVPVTDAAYAELMAAQASGKEITADASGAPISAAVVIPADILISAMRGERAARLTACDWTQTSDAPLTDDLKAEWRTYRQALRDLPSTVTDPTAITWPTPPALKEPS